jgi:hypothetical protein
MDVWLLANVARTAGFDWLDSYGGGFSFSFSVLNMASAGASAASATPPPKPRSGDASPECSTEDNEARALAAGSSPEAALSEERTVAQLQVEAMAARAVADANAKSAGASFLGGVPALLVPKSFFMAWGGVLVVAFDGFPPALAAVKQALNAHLAGQCAGHSREPFGSRWPKATLAATKDGRPPLTLAHLSSLRRLCAAHSSRLSLAAAAAAAAASHDAQRASSPLVVTSVAVSRLDVVHYEARGLEPAFRPKRTALPLARDPAPDHCLGSPGGLGGLGEVAGSSSTSEASASEASASERDCVRGVVSEWCGDRLPAYVAKANEPGSEASTYRRASPSGSTLVAFLDQPSDQATGLPAGLAAALAAFRKGVEGLFPGRFAWLDQGSLHCTLRALDAAAVLAPGLMAALNDDEGATTTPEERLEAAAMRDGGASPTDKKCASNGQNHR